MRASRSRAAVGVLSIGLVLATLLATLLVASAGIPPAHGVSLGPSSLAAPPGGGHGHPGSSFTCPSITGADTSVCSTNWAGYADATSSGVTYVSGSWTVPALSCPKHGTTYVAIWVGIDGYSSSTVEQTGVLGVCNHGVATYSAWYEFYPNPMVTISSLSVAPGSTVVAGVSMSGSNSFVATITVGTQPTYQTGPTAVTGAQASSAEWIVERPALCTALTCRLTTLADFGLTSFTSSLAKISGTTSSISTFSDAAITMVGGSSGPILAQPSSLTNSGADFSVSYG